METCAKALWSTASLDDLIKSFLTLLKTEFSCKHAYARVRRKGRIFSTQQLSAEGQKEAIFFHEPLFVNELFEKLFACPKEAALKCISFSCGIKEQSFQLSRMGDPDSDCVFLVWDKTLNTESDRFQETLETLQNELSWHLRLKSSEDLLYIDELTGLLNYRYLEIVIASEVKRASRYEQNFSLLFIDLDNFKNVNDSHGHLVGSDVLRQVGQALKNELREVDAIIRYGGDEYVALVLEADAKAGMMVAHRICSRIAATRFISGQLELRLSVSIGVASFPEHGRDKESLLQMADDSMYRSKRAGKNAVSLMAEGVWTSKTALAALPGREVHP